MTMFPITGRQAKHDIEIPGYGELAQDGAAPASTGTNPSPRHPPSTHCELPKV